MAKKPFETQSSILRVGGVDLEAGATTIVIPGVTQATNYSVDEVNENDSQSHVFDSIPLVIDRVTYNIYDASGTPNNLATYEVTELDDDGYIDDIIIVDPGSAYTSQQASTNESDNMYAYIGAETYPDMFTTWSSSDWIIIPFNPKMRPGDIENIGGGISLTTETFTGAQENNTFVVPTLQIGDPDNSVGIINATSTDSDRGGYAIVIQGQRGFGTWSTTGWGGDGTSVIINGGVGGESSTNDQGGEGGNIDIQGGVGQNGRDGGDLNLTAGNAKWSGGTNNVYGGHIWLTAGDALSGQGVAANKGYGGDIRLYSGIGNNAGGDILFYTSNNASSYNHTWIFKSDGSTVFPTLTVPISDNANPSGTGQTLKFTDSSQQAIIYGPPSDSSYNNADRIILQGAPGYAGTAGEGGDIYLWAGPGGDTNGDGGDIKIRGGRGYGTGNGGYLNFQAGNTVTGYGGWINLESGSTNTTGQGGDITVTAHSGGQILFQTYAPGYYTTTDWYLKKNGVTLFPNNSIAGEDNQLRIATKHVVDYDFDTTYFESGNGNVNGQSGQDAHSFTCSIRALQNSTYSVTTFTPGTGWAEGDYLTISGTDLGGTSPANDLTLTVDAVGGSGEITTLTPTGAAVGKEWKFDTDGTTYFASGATAAPVSAFYPGAPFSGTIISQASGEVIQVLAQGANASAGFGWVQSPNAPTGGVASITFNNTANSIDMLTGSFDTTTYAWQFGDDGITSIPGEISSAAGTGDVVINASDVGTSTWTFGGNGNLTLPNSGVIGEIANPSGFPGYSIRLQPTGYINSNQQLLVYPTGGQDFNHLHLTSGDLTVTDLYLGNDDQYVKVATDGKIYIGTNNNTKQWTFDSDGSTVFPNGAKLNNGTSLQFATDNGVVASIDLRDTSGRGFYTGSDGYTLRSNGTYNWIFGGDGRTKFPTATAPAHSYGAAGDTAGMVAFDSSYIYYCTANYVDNSTNIWKRVALDATPW